MPSFTKSNLVEIVVTTFQACSYNKLPGDCNSISVFDCLASRQTNRKYSKKKVDQILRVDITKKKPTLS